MDYLQDVYFSNLNVNYTAGNYFSITEKKDWSIGRHKFNQCKFYYVIEGECMIYCEGVDYHVRAGDWMFIPSMTEHSYYNLKTGPFKKYWAHFDLSPNLSIFNSLNLPYKITVGLKGETHKLFKKLQKAEQSNDVFDKITVKSCLLSLLAEYVKQCSISGIKVEKQSDERLNKVLKFINDNLASSLEVSTLAEKYFAHPTHFIRAFKEKTGYTPAKYIKQKRLEQAKLLLETTDLTVYEISEIVGINDVSHFSRDFKAFYNVPPLKYRTYHKN